jgi:ketosteroid isomerase-like protein
MEKETNTQIIQQLYADFGTGNLAGIANALTEDVSWTDLGYPDIPYAGKRHGKAEVLTYFEQLANMISITEFAPQEFYADQDVVLVKGFFAAQAKTTGKPLESDWLMLWKMRAGKVYYYYSWVDTLIVARALE